jgi:hypothetical protein
VGSDEVLGAVAGPWRVSSAPPFMEIEAPGSRMKITPVHGLVQSIVEPPLRVRVPDMKYTDTPAAKGGASLPFVEILRFVHLLVAV